MVGTYGTGVGAAAPPLASGRPPGPVSAGSGTQAGTVCSGAPGEGAQVVFFLESHPHPLPGLGPMGGLLPVNPSVLAAMEYRWPKNDGESCMENVASEMA